MSHSFYNQERKLKFLQEEVPNESTRTTYASLLSKIKTFEEDNQKDLCDFSLSEANDLLIGLRKTTRESLSTAHSIINKYVNWTIDINQAYSKTGFNSFKLIDVSDKEKFLHKVAQQNQYITREEMYSYCDELYNWVDKAIVAGMFEGMKGRPDQDYSFEELRNLKKTDLLPPNQIILRRFNKDGTLECIRPIQVDERTMDIFLKAADETEYHKDNGNARGKFSIMPLKDSPYIIRAGKKGGLGLETYDDGRIRLGSINSRFKIIRKYTGNNFITPTKLYFSGLFESCEQLEQEYGNLTTKHFRQILRDLKLDDRQGGTLKCKYDLYKRNKAI